MSVIDKAKKVMVGDPEKGMKAEQTAVKNIDRGEKVIKRFEARWRELWAHFDGDQFAYVSARDGQVTTLETREGGGKPSYQSRLTRNRMTKSITGEVSILTSRTPSYETTPLNSDPEKVNAARTGQKVLLSLYESLRVKRVTFLCGLSAAVTGDGYAWPYWNSQLGAPVTPVQGETPEDVGNLRTGDISIAVLRQEQVGWEPGVAFDDSRWHFVRLTRPVDEIMDAKGYIGPKELKPDARQDRLASRDGGGVERNLTFVYHYFEKPCDKYPEGRWLQICQGHMIAAAEDYPRADGKAVIHRLPWIERGDRRDRSLGVGELVIDIQRSITRIVNQIVTWRNLALVPQWLVPENAARILPTAEPGRIYTFKGQNPPQQLKIEEIPASLYKDLELAYADMDYIVGQGASIPAALSSGSGIQALNEREQSYRSMLIGNLAGFYAELGDHLLYLVAQHYTEDRMLEVKGRQGVESIPDFRGTVLKGTIKSVRVAETSIEPRTRAAQEAKIMLFADKGWITPQRAMSALQGGLADVVIDDFELDIARVHRQIQSLIQLTRNPNLEGITDPAMLLPVSKPYDNHEVFVDVIKSWMKTVEFENEHPLVQDAALNWLEMHQMAIQEEQMQKAQEAALMAESQGTANAAKDQGGPKAQASRPSMASEAAALGAPQ